MKKWEKIIVAKSARRKTDQKLCVIQPHKKYLADFTQTSIQKV